MTIAPISNCLSITKIPKAPNFPFDAFEGLLHRFYTILIKFDSQFAPSTIYQVCLARTVHLLSLAVTTYKPNNPRLKILMWWLPYQKHSTWIVVHTLQVNKIEGKLKEAIRHPISESQNTCDELLSLSKTPAQELYLLTLIFMIKIVPWRMNFETCKEIEKVTLCTVRFTMSNWRRT